MTDVSLLEANPFHADRVRTRAAPSRRRRQGLFHGYLIEGGKRRRATRDELREAYRLHVVHADIREGRL